MVFNKEDTRFSNISKFYFRFPEGYNPPQVANEATVTAEDPSQTIEYCTNLSHNQAASEDAKKVADKVLKLQLAAFKSDTFCIWHNGPDTISAEVPCDSPAQTKLLMEEITK